MKVAFKLGGALLALGLVIVVLAIIGFASGWGRTAVQVVSPENVKAQHELVIGHYNDLRAAADNLCTVQEAAAVEKSDRSPVLVESATLAYEATFRNIRADYNAAVENLFKAKIVMPAGYPTSTELNALDTKDWCHVTEQLDTLHG
jgi:hypothetical protein